MAEHDGNLEATIGRLVMALMITGVGAWIGALASFIELREPFAGAACLLVSVLAFGWCLASIVRAIR